MTPSDSPLEVALERVGDRWSLLVVEALLDGPQRFADLATRVPGIAPNILTQRLRRLEQRSVVTSTRYSDRPPRSAYSLTEDGRELAGVLRLLASWGAGGAEGVGHRPGAIRHLACGSTLEARWFCPTCAMSVDEAQASTLEFL